MAYLSDRDFWAAHAANRQTARYRALRTQKLEKVKFRCSVCGLDYLKRGYTKWQLQRAHRRYRDAFGRLIFGRETLSDFRVLCPDCHTKGISSDYSIDLWRG